IYKHKEAAVDSAGQPVAKSEKQEKNDKTKAGGYDTLPTFEVPRAVLQAALKAAKQIGDGFYGVDVKQWGDKACVIEVNDNPSIETGVEDLYHGHEQSGRASWRLK